MMDELIRKQDAIDAVNDVLAAYIPTFRPWQEEIPLDCALKIKALPPVQPKRGKWEYHSNPTVGINPEDAYCSCCGFHVDTTGNIDFDEYNFCPNCGADMRGEAK